MSDTPRTDALVNKLHPKEWGNITVPATHAFDLEHENTRLQVALKDAREMLGDASRDEINLLDELEKWDRAYAHLLANSVIRPNSKA